MIKFIKDLLEKTHSSGGFLLPSSYFVWEFPDDRQCTDIDNRDFWIKESIAQGRVRK